MFEIVSFQLFVLYFILSLFLFLRCHHYTVKINMLAVCKENVYLVSSAKFFVKFS